MIDTYSEVGLLTPSQLAPKFKGMDSKRVFTFLVNNKRNYLVSLISSLISKGYTTTILLADKLGVEQSAVEYFVENKMRGIRVETLELFDKPRAQNLILRCSNEEELLRELGYSESSIQTYKVRGKIDPLIRKLFDGKSFEEAKRFFTNHYLGQ